MSSPATIGDEDNRPASPRLELDAAVLRELDRTVVWHAFSQMATYDGLIIDSAKGCWLTDIDGNRFFDGASSLWCNIHDLNQASSVARAPDVVIWVDRSTSHSSGTSRRRHPWAGVAPLHTRRSPEPS